MTKRLKSFHTIIMETEMSKSKRRESIESDHNDHPVIALRKAVTLGKSQIKHRNGETTEISRDDAHKLLDRYNAAKKPDEKEEFVRRISHSRQGMEHYVAGHPEKKSNNLYSKISKDFHKRLPSVPNIGSTGGISA